MKALVTTIQGDFAHFRVPETTRENLSYPFPPKTAIIGMFAATLGIQKNEYWDENHPLQSLKVALEIINPLKRTFMKVNYIRVKEIINITRGTKIFLPEDPFATELIELKGKEYKKKKDFSKYKMGMNAPFKMNMMKDVAYRIYATTDNKELYDELKQRFIDRKFTFPPYLGHANLLAHWVYEGEYEIKPIYEMDKIECHSIVPFSALDMQRETYDLSGIPVIYNVPMTMKAVNPKKKISIWNMIVDKTDSVFLVRPDEPFVGYFKKGHAYTVKDIEKTITFL